MALQSKKLYRCIVTTSETTYVEADCEEDVKEMAICGQVNSVTDQEVFVSNIEEVKTIGDWSTRTTIWVGVEFWTLHSTIPN